MSETSTRRESLQIGRELGVYASLVGIVWILSYSVWDSFPYIRNGTDVIVQAKVKEIESGTLFRGNANRSDRVVILGDSRILCGFVPDIFDQSSGGRVTSYNGGLPGHSDYVGTLADILEAGNRPTHVFLVLPIPPEPVQFEADGSVKRVLWPPEQFEPSILHWFASDERILDTLFPFRGMPRDFFTFAILSRNRGGTRAFYEEAAQRARQVTVDRGFYFIDSQQLYPDGRLPDDFRLSTDNQERPFYPQKLDVSRPEFQRLVRLAEEYALQIAFVPGYRRALADAPPPPEDKQMAEALSSYSRFHVIGPNYFQYPNADFADAVHLNPDGARRYTDDLWSVTQQLLVSSPFAERQP